MSILTSFRKLTAFERALWLGSALAILLSFLCGRGSQPLTLIASLIGVTALIFVAKGDVLGQVLTAVFYCILKYFRTANLALSTVSITTSFLASYLTWCRSSYYALAYAANDVVLILLWVLAALQNPAYLPMIVCFAAFLVNDLYGYVNWKRMQKRQGKGDCFT